MRKTYRQGDVLFRAVRSLPKGERRLRADGIVMHGEATGHTHAVADLAAAEVLDIGEGRFVRVSAAGGVSIVHQEHGPIKLPKGNHEVTRQREYWPKAIRNVAD